MNPKMVIRSYTPADLAAMVRLGNERARALDEPAAETEEHLQRRFDNFIFGFKMERDLLLALRADELLGYAWTALNGEHSMGIIGTTVGPNQIESGALEILQAKAEKHIRKTLGGDRLPADRPFYIDTFAGHENETKKMEILQSLGYVEVRRFYDMLIALAEERPKASLPSGLVIKPFQREREARAYHAAYLEAFRDHWGNISIENFSEFEKNFDNPEFDESLWFAAWDGDEIAGLIFGERSRSHPHRGVVDLLGVRRRWRRLGLGKALLLQAFDLFQQQGLTEAELEVDAESRTNALNLYRRAGMHITNQSIVYRKMVWGELADIVE